MIERQINIIIVEQSQILGEGLSAIVKQSGINCQLMLTDDLQMLNPLQMKCEPDIVIINPELLLRNQKEFQLLKKELQYCWIALVYAFVDHQFLGLFDDIIYINNSSDEIIALLKKQISIRKNVENSINMETLSDREIDVLKLLVDGNQNKEIADKLNISIHTVISHRKNISNKTGIKSVAGLTIYAVVNNIISIENYKE